MPQVVLFGGTAGGNEGRLKRLLKTDWHVITIPDEAAFARLHQLLPQADALIGPFWNEEMCALPSKLRLVQALGAGVDA